MSSTSKVSYWHRELPPPDADPIGEHTVEAFSQEVRGSLFHRDEVWNACYDDLMASARERLEQEVHRLGGDYAHVLNEKIDVKRDDVRSMSRLHGRFDYVLYRRRSA